MEKQQGGENCGPPIQKGGGRTYRMSFPTKGGTRRCPVEGCLGALATRTEMWVHFVHRNVQDTVVMMEEGNLPHPRCPQCDMQVPRKALNGRHLGAANVQKG